MLFPKEDSTPPEVIRFYSDLLLSWIRGSSGVRHKLLEFVEHPLVLTAGGLLAGAMGFFYAPVLVILGICIVLGFHRVGVVRGRSWRVQITSYLVVVLATGFLLYVAHMRAQKILQEENVSISDLTAKAVAKRTQPSTPPSASVGEIANSSPQQSAKAPTETKSLSPDQVRDLGREIAKDILPPSASPSEAFSVDIEHRIFTPPGRYGTSFWFGSFFFSSCSLEPIPVAIFLRITNLQKHKEMITAYGFGALARTQIRRGRIFVILPKGQIGPEFMPHSIDFGSPAGMGSLVQFSIDDADTSKAIPLSGEFLDDQVGENHYLEPDESVRGWVFFEYSKDRVFIPAHLTITISDALQKTFSYLIPDHAGDPGGDTLSRRLTEGPIEDLSHCSVIR